MRATGWAGALAGLTAAYAVLVEPRWIVRTRTTVRIDGLPYALRGLRIALLSDLHFGHFMSEHRVRRACRLAMSAQPDLIAITGDLVSRHSGSVARVVRVLDEELEAPLGVYVVPGNHDHDAGIAEFYRQLHRHPRLVSLTNRDVVVHRDGAALRLCGVDDVAEGTPRLDVVVPEEHDMPTILLSHSPDLAEHALARLGRIDLVLSGHTHGGQVRLPGVGALVNPSRYDEIYEAGLYERPWSQVYVSRGLGMIHLPVRFFSRPEVAILELVAD